jgi:hypothetical protein
MEVISLKSALPGQCSATCDAKNPLQHSRGGLKMTAMSNQEWIETTATVYSCGWEDTPSRGFMFRTLSGLFSGHYLIVFSYTVDGNHYSGEFTSEKEWQEGSTFAIKCDPQRPEKNDQSESEDGPLTTILTWVLAIAIVALYVWWKNHHK